MADPEQIYQEVLSEEQAKGSATPVAEGRAKAARARAQHGSPHPKEAKWWPGAQPQFEGGDGAAPEEAPAAEAEEEAPAAEAEAAPAEETPAPPAEPVAEPQEQPADAQPAPAEPAPAAAPQPAAASAPAAVAAPPAGVAPGSPTGNRLRPEDSVATDAQFDAQKALIQRRKLIDELVATGVPAAAAEAPVRRGGGVGLLLVYILIVAAAIGFLVTNQEELAGAEGGGEGIEHEGEGPPAGGSGLVITAQNVAFDTDTLELTADEEQELLFQNNDAASVPHNVAIYEDDSASAEIFVGEVIDGGSETTYTIPATPKGEYYFQCDVHPSMSGTASFK